MGESVSSKLVGYVNGYRLDFGNSVDDDFFFLELQKDSFFQSQTTVFQDFEGPLTVL